MSTTDYLLDYIKLRDVFGIKIEKCYFNGDTDFPNGKRGIGIRSDNASFTKTKPLKEKNKLEINPNPAVTYFIVKYDNEKIVPGFSSIYLYDSGWKVVSEKMLEDSCGILLFETTSLKSGIYYICTIVGNEFIDCKNVAITRWVFNTKE